MSISRRISGIARICLLRNLPPYLILTLFLFALSFITISPMHWEEKPTAIFAECIFSISGPILISGIFLPEQDSGIRDTLSVRKTPLWVIFVVRAICSLLALLFIIAAGNLVLALLSCEIMPWLYQSCLSSAMLLGGLGAFAFALCKNIATAYLFPAIYYVFSIFMADDFSFLGVFYLSVTTLPNPPLKLIQLFIGLALLGISIIIKARQAGK